MARVKKEKKEKKEKTGKKGGKKKLLILLLGLLLVAAAAAAVVLLVLPRLVGEDDGLPKDEVPKKGLESYTIGEDSAASLDTLLEEGEGTLLALRGPGKPKGDESTVEERYTYIYELESYAEIVDRYLDAMMEGEQPFSLVDESYLILEERPELADAEGALILARPSVQEGHVFQLVIGWSQASNNLAVRASVPEGALHKPEKKPEFQAATVREQLDTLEAMRPEQLTLSGTSMSEYDIYPVEGFVNINGYPCRRFNFYERGSSGDIAGIIFLSGDQQHIFRMDVEDNTIITELK